MLQIAAEDDDEAAFVDAERDAIREPATVGRDPGFISRSAGWTRKVLVGRGHHVAKIDGVELLHETQLPEDPGCTVDMLRLAGLIVGAQADARRRSQDGD